MFCAARQLPGRKDLVFMKSQNYYYDEIMNLHGLNEIKEMIKKWNTILMNLQSKSENVPILLPNLFLKSKAGAGKSKFLELISEYLYNTGCMPFYGNVKFFEFFLEYCPQNGEMREINRFAQQLKNAAGFRNEFKGVVAIDITEWAGHVNEDNFITFLEYLAIIDANVCIVFIENGFDEVALAQAEKVLNSFCRIRSVDFFYPDSLEFANYCLEQFKKYNLSFDDSALSVLNESIEKLMQSGYFYGYKTINRLCLDIVFELGSDKQIKNGKVSEKHLIDFAKDSDFINNICTVKKITRIGFGGVE